MSEDSLDLLNIYEIDEPTGLRHLVCFLEPVLAGARGIEGRSVIGEFTPRTDGEFDPHSFQLNGEFVEAFVAYMNQEMVESPELAQQARENPDGWLHLIDPRATIKDDDEPPLEDLLGGFAIDDQGRPIAGSFRYNPDHVMFDPTAGPSGILTDRRFYDWLHALPTA